MTVPITGITPIYGIEYLVEGEPVRNTRAKLERNAKQIEAALAAGGLAPPGTPDLAALSGRVSVLEGTAPVEVTFLANARHYATGAPTSGIQKVRVWKNGRTVHISGLLQTTAAIGATAEVQVATVPVGYRPAAREIFASIQAANSAARFDVYPDGKLNLVSGAGGYASGLTFPIVGAWSVD